GCMAAVAAAIDRIRGCGCALARALCALAAGYAAVFSEADHAGRRGDAAVGGEGALQRLAGRNGHGVGGAGRSRAVRLWIVELFPAEPVSACVVPAPQRDHL